MRILPTCIQRMASLPYRIASLRLTANVESDQQTCQLDEVRHVPQTTAAPADPARY
jgi:hypothetical protein